MDQTGLELNSADSTVLSSPAAAVELEQPAVARPFRLSYRAQIAASIVLAKATVLLVVFLAYKLLPFFSANFQVNFVDPLHSAQSLATAFSTWDAQHYLYLSEHGYHAGEISVAFFPLFPLLVHLVTPLTHSSLVAGLLVSNVASLIGLCLLFELVYDLHGRKAAENTLLLYLAFPTAFFFSLVYSESVFLLLASAFFLLLFRRQIGWAAVPAALLPLARPEGILILLPFATYYIIEVAGLGRRPLEVVISRMLGSRSLLVLSPLLGAAAYLSFMKVSTGNALEMFVVMKAWVSDHSLSHVLHPIALAQQLLAGPLAIHGFNDSIIDRALFCVFLLLLIPMARRLHPALLVFALSVGLLNVLSGTFMSYSRYLLLAFPVFIAAGLLLRGRHTAFLKLPLLYCLIMVQGLFVVMQALNYWVA